MIAARTPSSRPAAIAALAELFREHGYEGASLSRIEAATGLGKGSLYHCFPGGKPEMAAAVLAEIDAWFDRHVFQPLLHDPDAAAAVSRMLDAVSTYFRSGQRVCLVGAFALDTTRDRFASGIQSYFVRWNQALASALSRVGSVDRPDEAAELLLAAIQGGLVLARATNDPAAFERVVRAATPAVISRPRQL